MRDRHLVADTLTHYASSVRHVRGYPRLTVGRHGSRLSATVTIVRSAERPHVINCDLLSVNLDTLMLLLALPLAGHRLRRRPAGLHASGRRPRSGSFVVFVPFCARTAIGQVISYCAALMAHRNAAASHAEWIAPEFSRRTAPCCSWTLYVLGCPVGSRYPRVHIRDRQSLVTPVTVLEGVCRHEIVWQ